MMNKLKFNLTTVLLVFCAFSSFSCIGERNYGPLEKETRNIGDFSEIEVSHGIDVYITIGNRTSLEVETSEDLMDKLVTEVRGDKLRIYFDGNFIWARNASVYVEAKQLTRIDASGGSDVKGEEVIEGRDLELNASGGSDIRMKVNVDNLEVEVSGGADIELYGSANYLDASTSGGSDLRAYDLITRVARLEASGGSDIKVTVEDEMEARASGGADIKYKGNPDRVDARDSSGGDVTRIN